MIILLQNLDYSQFFPPKKKSGRPPASDPYTMMLILLYARTQGKFSSRDIERLCKRDLFLKDIGKKENMTYDAENDRFICTKGKKLEMKYVSSRKNQYGYVTETHIYRCERGCKCCKLRKACMKKSKAS